jgi:FAD/FMN-containing dehydrogenase/Fe-S oxidoreductase
MGFETTVRELSASPDSPVDHREIPFNYTSADDRRVVTLLLGPAVADTLEQLRSRRVTGRSARLLMRILGEILIHRRNPYLFQELVDSTTRQRRLFESARKDLATIEANAGGENRTLDVVGACRGLLDGFMADVRGTPKRRSRIRRALGGIVEPRNIAFDPFALVSHATDATDWRLHLPVAVVWPTDEAQVAPLLAAIGRLGLKAIPRGAGTGLTGGAVPLRADCVVVNTERLDRIRGVSTREFHLADGRVSTAQVIELEAGVVTERAMGYAGDRGLVFATDPTSAWASTIGGNISENAGGRLAVRWGTCIDNLLSWRMAMPGGGRWTVRRTDHQLRKILPGDRVTFEVAGEDGAPVDRITLRGDEIRRNGLWKDITNKALGGVPGAQKEGTDGVVTSAEFVLYPRYEAQRTICLEFFGADMGEAGRVILELSRAFPFPDGGAETLTALEHFDEEYVRAIDYKVKASRAEPPKAVLLVDVSGHSVAEAARGVERVKGILEPHANTRLFEARNAAEATRFWADRKRLGAIARRTNAFKLNEDIVIPLEALAEFARFIDTVNGEEERHAQVRFVERALRALGAASRLDGEQLEAKLASCAALCSDARSAIGAMDAAALRSTALLDALRRDLAEVVRGYPEIQAALERLHQHVRDRRIVLATHMHAGDGNVHVNVPVLSSDRGMLQRADQVIDAVMAKVVELGGVVSGEHGIGITKLKYVDRRRIDELTAYRRGVDPRGTMNPGKLEDFGVLDLVFTPSFNLLELEARILQHGQIERLSRKIAHCVRCGKCKPDCCVNHPARGMFYHPRNKNLAIGSLIEAVLYEAQRKRSTRFELVRWLDDVADHCTVCHKCLKPCPVDIDSGEVSVLEREILGARGYRKTPLATRLTLRYLESRSPLLNGVFRSLVVRAGASGQRLASALSAPLQPADAPAPTYAMRLLRSPMPRVPAASLSGLVPSCQPDQALVLEPEGRAARTVFYFPGCGSERLHSSVSLAAVHVLLQTGTRVVLPPPFLCCGFPAHVNAKTAMHGRIVLRDTILFTQIRDMFAHLDFDACVVSCGTCREGLEGMDAGRLFGGRIVDVAAYALESGLRLRGGGGSQPYHAPCHDSLDGKADAVLQGIGGFGRVKPVPHCCSEAGTLSLSRPDITDNMLHRKREALGAFLASHAEPSIVLTNCPSCLQGLGRNQSLGFETRHVAVALAERLSGPEWEAEARASVAHATALDF